MLEEIIKIAKQAWDEVMRIYQDPSEDFELDKKDDNSPVTKADIAAHDIIVSWLKELDYWFPLLSEEWASIPYEERKEWDTYWCIDPLDWTKEFINRNWEFTINIALIQDNKPVLWVVYVPALEKTYAADNKWAFLRTHKEQISLQVNKKKPGDELNVVWSRSHHSDEVDAFITNLEEKWYKTSFVSAGSSLKFCLIAEGKADVYPRFVPTMERDTAAAHCILEQSWWSIHLVNGWLLSYNRENLRNWYFIAKGYLDYS